MCVVLFVCVCVCVCVCVMEGVAISVHKCWQLKCIFLKRDASCCIKYGDGGQNKQKLKRLHKKNTIYQYVYFPYKVSTDKIVFIKTKIIREQINTQSNKKRKAMENNTTSKIPWSCWKWHRHCSVHIALHLFRSGVHAVVINSQKQFYLFSQARKHMESCTSLRNFRRNLNFQVTMLVFPG